MNLPSWVRRTHKWIGLVIGAQALLWMTSGVYMTAISLDIIHGDHLVHVGESALRDDRPRIDTDRIAALYPGFESLRLKTLLGREVYEVRRGSQSYLVDARDATLLSPLPRETIVERAREIYQGDAEVRQVTWVTKAPQEVAKRPLPMWAVHFDDRASTTLYFSPISGDLLARRHDLWRWFDFLWMLHIMDYDARTDVNNLLLRLSAGVGLIFAASGAWLVYFSFRKKTGA